MAFKDGDSYPAAVLPLRMAAFLNPAEFLKLNDFFLKKKWSYLQPLRSDNS